MSWFSYTAAMDELRPDRSELGRALAALRRTVTRPCVVCGRAMTGKTHRKTCSVACRNKLYRARKEQTRREDEDNATNSELARGSLHPREQ